MNTYAGYVQCNHCGVYDSDPRLCVLCGKPKDIGEAALRRAADRVNGRTSVLVPNESCPSIDRRGSQRRRASVGN